jgi:DNA modification methylase
METLIAEETTWARIRSLAFVASDRYALFLGDAAESLSTLPSNSINTCVTSPPYWSARDYGHLQQIGLETSVEEYVLKLVEVFSRVRRVLTDDGTLWLNIGDTYLNGCGTIKGRPPEKGWKRNKQLSLVPYRVAMALQEDGWWLRNVVCWNKPNAMPSSVRDRLTNTWEPVFLFAKSEKYYFDLDAIRLPHQTDDATERRRAEKIESNGKAKGNKELRRWLNSPRHRVTIDGLKEVRVRPNAPKATALAAYLREALFKKKKDIQWVADKIGEPFERTRHYFRTDEIGSRLPPEDTWLKLKVLLDLGTEFDETMRVVIKDNVFRNHPKGKNPGDVINIAASGNSRDHYATMPLSLAEWALKSTLPPQGVCLDPFMGTGTSGLAALRLGGYFIGIDILEGYIENFVQRCRKIPIYAPLLKLI